MVFDILTRCLGSPSRTRSQTRSGTRSQRTHRSSRHDPPDDDYPPSRQSRYARDDDDRRESVRSGTSRYPSRNSHDQDTPRRSSQYSVPRHHSRRQSRYNSPPYDPSASARQHRTDPTYPSTHRRRESAEPRSTTYPLPRRPKRDHSSQQTRKNGSNSFGTGPADKAPPVRTRGADDAPPPRFEESQPVFESPTATVLDMHDTGGIASPATEITISDADLKKLDKTFYTERLTKLQKTLAGRTGKLDLQRAYRGKEFSFFREAVESLPNGQLDTLIRIKFPTEDDFRIRFGPIDHNDKTLYPGTDRGYTLHYWEMAMLKIAQGDREAAKWMFETRLTGPQRSKARQIAQNDDVPFYESVYLNRKGEMAARIRQIETGPDFKASSDRASQERYSTRKLRQIYGPEHLFPATTRDSGRSSRSRYI